MIGVYAPSLQVSMVMQQCFTQCSLEQGKLLLMLHSIPVIFQVISTRCMAPLLLIIVMNIMRPNMRNHSTVVFFFKKTRENSLELTSGGTVSILKSAVAVPTVAALIVEVDLYASSDRVSEEHLEGVSLFDFKNGAPISSEIKCLNYDLVLSVEWSGVFKKVSKKKSAS